MSISCVVECFENAPLLQQLSLKLIDNSTCNFQWVSKICTSSVFKWLKHVQKLNGLFLKPWSEYLTKFHISDGLPNLMIRPNFWMTYFFSYIKKIYFFSYSGHDLKRGFRVCCSVANFPCYDLKNKLLICNSDHNA